MGKAICMLDLPRQKPSPGRFTFGGGSKVRNRCVTPYPPFPAPPYSTEKAGEVKIVQCPTHCPTHCPKTVSKKFADVCNQLTPKVHISLQKLLKIDGKAKDKIM